MPAVARPRPKPPRKGSAHDNRPARPGGRGVKQKQKARNCLRALVARAANEQTLIARPHVADISTGGQCASQCLRRRSAFLTAW